MAPLVRCLLRAPHGTCAADNGWRRQGDFVDGATEHDQARCSHSGERGNFRRRDVCSWSAPRGRADRCDPIEGELTDCYAGTSSLMPTGGTDDVFDVGEGVENVISDAADGNTVDNTDGCRRVDHRHLPRLRVRLRFLDLLTNTNFTPDSGTASYMICADGVCKTVTITVDDGGITVSQRRRNRHRSESTTARTSEDDTVSGRRHRHAGLLEEPPGGVAGRGRSSSATRTASRGS